MSEDDKTRTAAGQDNRFECGGGEYCKDSDNLSIAQDNPQEMFDLHQARKMPIDGLPQFVQDIITEYSAALVAPRDFVAAAVLVTVATAVGKRLSLKTGSFINHPCLWMVLVAPSGFNKSTPVKYIINPLTSIDFANYERYQEERLAAMGMEISPDVKWEQIIISDTTPEARNMALAMNPTRLLLHRDELRGMIDDIGRYNKSGEVSQMLQVWSGEGYPVNRKKDNPLLISDPYMNVIGGIQPSVLDTTFGRPLLMGNGWNHRFLFCYPELGIIEKRRPREIDPVILSDWNGWVLRIVETYDSFRGECLLSADARAMYDNYCDRIIDEMNATDDDYRRGALSKFKIHVLRLATTVFAMIGGSEVSGKTMDYCIRLCDYFQECALLVQQRITQSQQHTRDMGNEDLLRMVLERFPVEDRKKQSALADALGVSRQHITNIKNR